MVRVSSFYPELLMNDTPDTSYFHQSSNSWSGYLNAPFVKLTGDLRTPIAPFAFFMNTSDQLEDALTIYLSGRWLSVKPIVVAASAHFKCFAHLLNGKHRSVLLHKPEYLLSLLEKMLTGRRALPFLECHVLSQLLVAAFLA